MTGRSIPHMLDLLRAAYKAKYPEITDEELDRLVAGCSCVLHDVDYLGFKVVPK